MFRRIILLKLLIVLPLFCFAQNSVFINQINKLPDSLRQEFIHSHVKELYKKDSLLASKEIKQAFLFFKNNESVYAALLGAQANNLFENENCLEALEYEKRALEIYETAHDFENEINSIKKLSRIYLAVNKSNEAIALLIKKLNEQQGNKEKECVLLERIGVTFKEIKNADKALIYLLLAEEKAKEVNAPSPKFSTTLLTIYKNIGVLYRNKSDFAKAVYYFDKCYALADKTNNIRYKGIILNSLGILYKEKKEYLKAIEAFEASIKLKQEVENSAGVSNSYSNLAALYLEIKNYSKAEKNYQLAYTIAVQSKQKKAILEVCEGFYRFYDKLNKPSLAYPYLKRAFILKDSIYSSSIAEESAKLETIYNTEKKQKEIEIGKIKNQQLEKDVKSKNRERNIFIGSALLLGLFLIWSVRSFLQKKKVNNQLEEKNNLINKQKLLVEEKQKEILDSIRYAKKIQNAHLTSESYVHKNLNRLQKK